MKAFMFPGQGSQAKGMGGSLFDDFQDLTAIADKILGYSIKELCLLDPRKELGKTQFTQPALFVVNALAYYKKVQESGKKPDFVVGHSLGEFNALLAAECFDFEAGIKLVKKRGELMSEASGGGMAAIKNATKEEIEKILSDNGLINIDLANFNTRSQIVISGLKEEIAKAEPFFQKDNMMFYPLFTSGAFHSRHMQGSKEKFEAYLKKFKFSDPTIPVVANVTGNFYQKNDVIANLSAQIAGSVRWYESIEHLMDQGATEFIEVGFGEVLTRMFSVIQQDATKLKSNSPEQDATVKKTTESNAASKNPTMDGGSNISAPEKVRLWNDLNPVGTKVKSSVIDNEVLETRTQAIVLFGHRAAVYMKGYNGYFDIDEINVA